MENKLFATLDPTTRKFSLGEGSTILLTDTVGFISNLPHTLINAFRSTLEEASFADLLLIVVDASDPECRKQYEQVVKVLGEIGADKIPRLILLNKWDAVKSYCPGKKTGMGSIESAADEGGGLLADEADGFASGGLLAEESDGFADGGMLAKQSNSPANTAQLAEETNSVANGDLLAEQNNAFANGGMLAEPSDAFADGGLLAEKSNSSANRGLLAEQNDTPANSGQLAEQNNSFANGGLLAKQNNAFANGGMLAEQTTSFANNSPLAEQSISSANNANTSALIASLNAAFPGAVKISAKTKEGFTELSQKITENLLGSLSSYLIPMDKANLVELARKNGTILKEEWLEDGIHLEARIPGVIEENGNATTRTMALLNPYAVKRRQKKQRKENEIQICKNLLPKAQPQRQLAGPGLLRRKIQLPSKSPAYHIGIGSGNHHAWNNHQHSNQRHRNRKQLPPLRPRTPEGNQKFQKNRPERRRIHRNGSAPHKHKRRGRKHTWRTAGSFPLVHIPFGRHSPL